MLRIIVGVILALLLGVLVLALRQPDTFRVERSIDIHAPADKVYPLIADFRRWPEWSPWEKLDPAMKRTLSGAESGTGAVSAWSGNDQAGEGRMEIVKATPPTHLTIQLDFVRPMEDRNTVEFALQPAADNTRVVWSMQGDRPFFLKIVTLFVSMDRMIGTDFEKGLAQLKALAEK